ncbi:CPBP family intramembrane metalloprotease, partial [Salmonella enterica]|nr:CPBP family intramembrane metalloprotease [Salmonella enterica]
TFFCFLFFCSRYCWTMWLGALITSLLFVAAHSQYQNLLTLAELFLVGVITSAAGNRSGGLLLPVLLHMEVTVLTRIICLVSSESNHYD